MYINVDSKTISQNPLYAAWKSKSFTDNDLMLHFFILDLLHAVPDGMTAASLCDEISRSYGVVFDSQTVRLKLKEYENLGILRSGKSGRNLVYALSPRLPVDDAAWSQLMDAMEFFQDVYKRQSRLSGRSFPRSYTHSSRSVHNHPHPP